jgi:tetratricopeptide (TPR) repeat protein
LKNMVRKFGRKSKQRKIHWSFEEIELFTTEQIISKLKDFGVPFDQRQFLADVEKFYSGEDLAEHWRQVYLITAQGFDEDFIWMAVVVLWDRLAPHITHSEKLDNMMQDGYDLLEKKGQSNVSTKACLLWLEVWEKLKERFSEDIKSIGNTDRIFNGTQSLFNWCQDLEMELYNAGLEEAHFFEKRIIYCQEFCRFFPESDELIVHNMRRAEAESYFKLGKIEEGDQAFQSLIRDYPDNAWGYIGWGDEYRLNDAKRAEKIYRMALEINLEDREDVVDRLRSLEGGELG